MPFDLEAARSELGDVRKHDAAALRAQVETLAVPRLSGSEGSATVEQSLRDAFEGLGYDTKELPFSFSTWPGRFGATVAGVLLALTGAGGAALLYYGLPVLALILLVVGLALTLLPLVLLAPALRRLPLGRVDSSNLLFTRPGSRPAWIVMAHRDSKSQLVPTLVRTAAVVAGAVGWVALVVAAALWFGGELFQFPSWALLAGGVVTLSGLVLALAWSSNNSPGALDNATGLAVLLAIANAGPGDEVGFLVTDGEELGLAGAREAVEPLPPVQGVINLDGLDDRGVIRIAEGHGVRRRGSAPQLAAALLTTARALDIEVVRQPLPRTIMVDHIPFAAAGVPALTILRGKLSSLLRVHRGGDKPDRLDGRGAAETATLLTGALRLLRAKERDHLAGGQRPPA